MSFVVLTVLLVIVIYASWWNLIDDAPRQKVRDLGLSLIGGIVGIGVFGGLVFWLCQAIAVVTHEPFRF